MSETTTDDTTIQCDCGETFASAAAYGGHVTHCGEGTARGKGTIKIPKDDFDRHNEQRKAAGLTWPEYVNGQSPDLGGVGAELSEQLDRIENATTSTEERVAALERQLEDLQR